MGKGKADKKNRNSGESGPGKSRPQEAQGEFTAERQQSCDVLSETPAGNKSLKDDLSLSRDKENTLEAHPPQEKKQVSDDNIDPTMLFENVSPSLSSGILRALARPPFEFTKMTPVQAAVIPLFLRHKDVCVQAETGSGKTLAFLLPMIEMLLRKEIPLKRNEIGGLVISPTRELAIQTHTISTVLCEEVGLPKPLLLVGGSNRSVLKDLECFHEYGSDIIVATPGRLEDVLSRYDNIHLNSQNFECLILDEADILLDMGFENTLSSILARVPKMRRTGLFSATQTKAVKMLGRAGLRNPVMVNVSVDATANNEKNHVINNSKISVAVPSTQQATPSSLTNYYMVCPLDEKLSRLVEFIRQHRDEKIVVFCISCAIVEFFGVVLPQIDPLKGIAVESLHGKMVQKRREKVLERFRSSEKKGGILICTDVAARGLDVSDVNWVLQFDAPPDPNAFVHRVGRCARAGRSGRSLIFLSGKEDAYVEFLRLRKIPTEPLPASERCTLPSSEVKSAVPTSKEKGVLKNDDEQSEQVLEAKQLLSHDGERILDILPCIKLIVLHDREALEKGTKAFTSYIRAYKEHQCSFIFRFNSLDFGLLATSFCLLRLPKMPELKMHLGKLSFIPAGPEINIHAIAFKDKAREKARQKRLAAELAAGGKNAKQIKAEQRAADRIQRAKERRQTAIAKGRNPDKKRGKQQRIFDEWDDLAKEERLHKRLRKGKISQKEYDGLLMKTLGSSACSIHSDDEENDASE